MDRDLTSLSTPDLLTSALARLRRRGGAALAGGLILQLPATVGCVDAPALAAEEQADWVQYEGKRDTSMVSYTGGFSSVCRYPNTRFGCGGYEIFIKLRVKPVAGADLAWKRVGVVYRTLDDTRELTAIGNYHTTWGNGDEEWHVPVLVAASQRTLIINAWYQDGAGHTYFDDNAGERHIVNDGPSENVVRVEPWRSSVAVHPDGVRGPISIQLADLDFDKDLKVIATKDHWNTVIELGMGAPGQPNRLYWVEDYPWSGRERWVMDVDLPGPADHFEYAVVYQHGIVNGARVYAFWDNNFGQNYRATTVTP